jgi:hypothetical protein
VLHEPAKTHALYTTGNKPPPRSLRGAFVQG